MDKQTTGAWEEVMSGEGNSRQVLAMAVYKQGPVTKQQAVPTKFQSRENSHLNEKLSNH